MSKIDEKPDAAKKEPYEAPSVIYAHKMEALASSCADCDITDTKNSGSDCPSSSGDTCASFNS